MYSPTTYDFALGFSDSDIVTDNHELGPICFCRVESSILFLGQTEIENVSGIIPRSAARVVRDSVGDL